MKYALIIGNDRYTDQKLAKLKTPAADSQALARVLKDQNIGSFDEVIALINKTEVQVSRAISAFLANKNSEDLVLVYFSGHGVLDDRGRLFLALKDTQTSLLKSTAISSSFIADEMDSCRSKRQILILDCCHSGAFERGVKAGEQKVITETTFEGSGFGRVVLTASASTQYALEGDQVIKQTELSLFTHFLLEGLQTGKADKDNDGYISLDEWYDYAYTEVLSSTPKQVPHKWSYHQQGDLIIGKNPLWKKKAAELPVDLVKLLESPYSSAREIAVKELGGLLHSHDSDVAELARITLEKLKNDDSRTVSLAAVKQLSELEKPFEEDDLALEKAVREILEREAAEKAKQEEIEREATERAARQKAKREATEKSNRERAERQAALITALKETLSKSSTILKKALPRAKSVIIIVGILGIVVVLFSVRPWTMLQELFPTSTVPAKATTTGATSDLGQTQTAAEPATTSGFVGTDTPTEPTGIPVSGETDTPTEAATETSSLLALGGADKIAFVANKEIWLMNVDGSDPIALTEDGGTKSDLQWLPDTEGEKFTFISGLEVKLYDLKTHTADTLVRFVAGSSLNAFRVSHDGKSVMLSLNNQIFVFPFDDKMKEVHTRDDLLGLEGCIYPEENSDYSLLPVREALWSADDQFVAWFYRGVDLNTSKHIQQVSVLDIHDCNPAAIVVSDNFPAGRFPLGGDQISDVDWAENRNHLFVFNTNKRNYVIKGEWKIGWGDLYVYDWTKKGQAVRINPIDGACCYRDARWSPDGTYLFFAFQDERPGPGAPTRLYYVPYSDIVAGTKLTALPLSEDFFTNPKEALEPAVRPVQ
jgi:uncharacterized caspase-like protein